MSHESRIFINYNTFVRSKFWIKNHFPFLEKEILQNPLDGIYEHILKC